MSNENRCETCRHASVRHFEDYYAGTKTVEIQCRKLMQELTDIDKNRWMIIPQYWESSFYVTSDFGCIRWESTPNE